MNVVRNSRKQWQKKEASRWFCIKCRRSPFFSNGFAKVEECDLLSETKCWFPTKREQMERCQRRTWSSSVSATRCIGSHWRPHQLQCFLMFKFKHYRVLGCHCRQKRCIAVTRDAEAVPLPLLPHSRFRFHKCGYFISSYPTHKCGSGCSNGPLPLPLPHPWL